MKNLYAKKTLFLGVKQLTLLIGLLLGSLFARAQAPDFAWVRQSQVNNNSTSVNNLGIAHDNFGNSYVTGWFRGSVTFGSNTSNSITLTNSSGKKNNSGSWDTYVAKYDHAGNLMWAKQSSGSNDEVSRSIAADASGNCYVTGIFEGRAKFGSATLNSNGSMDAFVVKYNTNGVVEWAKQSNSPGNGYADTRGIAIDALSNCYITGILQNSATFGNTTLTDSGGNDLFVVKYDALGNMLWATKAGGTGTELPSSIAVDGLGDSYVTGYFSVGSGSATFGNTLLTSSGSSDIFLAKFKTDDGTVLWAKQAGGTGPDNARDIAADASGNSYITGNFQGNATFGSGTASSITLTGGGNFRAKYDDSGNLVWAKNSRGGSSIAVDGIGNTYITGSFSGSATFGNITLISSGSEDIFIAKYDTDGNDTWAKQAGGTGTDRGSSITVDGSGYSYIAGSFQGSATFGSTPPNNTTLISSGSADVFIAKIYEPTIPARYAQTITGKGRNGKVLLVQQLNVYPNPFTEKLNLQISSDAATETAKITLTTTDGKRVYQKEVKLKNGRVSEELNDLSRLPAGMYFLSLQVAEKPIVQKVMKQ